MGKGTGLIGNFKGKVGNTVGYKISASNTGNTQGIRVYQPIVKNPKTSAQAEQRAKLAPINATYRALKMVIDRGNESLPYGNKSRLAWLKQAFKAEYMPWFVKDAVITDPVVCQLTKGSLPALDFTVDDSSILVSVPGTTTETAVNKVSAVSTAFMAAYPFLKNGDQITFVYLSHAAGALQSRMFSFQINSKSTEAISGFTANADTIDFSFNMDGGFGAVIVSREGYNGEHLRSNTSLKIWRDIATNAPYDATSKAAAVESYMSSASTNSDWAEESIQ